MPEEIKPVNQPGYMAPIVPDYSGTNGTIPTNNREIDAYALMEKRLSSIGKPPTDTFTELPATILPGTGRFPKIFPGEDNEEIYAQGQTWGSKMVNDLGKGLSLTGTTLLQSTVGLANGIFQSFADGRAASFYDNDFNRNLDEFNKELENSLPNYYTQKEKNAEWYSPDKLFTANFFWDGIIKNMGFAAGAAISGYGYAAGLKALSALPKMAKLFSVGKAAETLAATEEAILASGKAAETYGKVKQLSDKFLGTYNSLNTGQRILVAGLATTGEAGFEAYQNLNEFRNKKIEEYKEANGGLIPTGAELDKINADSESVGNASFLGNIALLTATNYIQFPKILGSSTKLEKGVLDQTVKEIGDITKDVAGKYIPTPAKYGKVFSAINKIRPYLFSASEAFEEGAQFAIGKATNDYYDKKQKGDDASFMNSLTDAIASTIGTTEGMENVLIGGLSGAIMQARGKYREGVEKGISTQEAIKLFNESPISNFTKETRESVSRGVVLQEEREKKLSKGDVFGSKDVEADYIINYLTPRIKYGRMDLVQSDINEYRTLASTDKGFAQLIAEGKALEGDTQPAYLERLNNLESTAENVKSLYQSLTLRYGNRVLPDGKTPVYNQEVMNKMIYAASKVADYDNRIPQLSSKLVGAGIDSNSIIDDVLKDSDEQFNIAVEKINELRNSPINPLNDDQVEDLQLALVDLTKSSISRKKFIDEYNEIKKTPEQFTTPALTEEEKKLATEEDGTPKQTIRVKTKDGDEDLEVGTEYFLGRIVKKDEKKNEVYGFPRLTILGENEDGTVKVRDSEGQLHDIPKAELLKFKLGKVSDTLANKKAKWFMENANSMFEMKRKGGKKPIPGRLEYSPKDGILDFVYKDFKGEEQRIEVTGDQFVAKDGYANALITKVGEYTAVQKQALEEFEKQEDPRKVDKLANRLAVINNLYETTKARLTEVNKKLENNKKKLNDAQEGLDNLSKTAKGLPRKSFTKAIRSTIDSLSSTKTFLENENIQLENEQDELETNLAYFTDMISNIGEFPTDKGIIDELKEDVDVLEELIENTASAIKDGKSLLESVDAALVQALSLFNDFVKRLKEENPDTPLFLEQFQQKLEKYLGEEGARLFIQDKLGYTEAVMDLEDQIDTFKAELKIPELTAKVQKLKEQISELSSGIDDLIKEQIAKATILEAFENAAEKYRQKKSEEDRIKNNEALMSELMGSADPGLQTRTYDKAYEAVSKKADLSVVLSTITPSKSEQPHVKRANLFGINFGKFTQAKKDKTKGVVITSKNEADYGLAKLTQHLKDVSDVSAEEKAAIKPDQTVVFLIVAETKSGSYRPVDVNGNVIEDSGEAIDFNNTIYQTFPDPKLQWSAQYNNESMFRKGETPQTTLDYYKNEYSAWHADALANPSNNPRSFEASFGIPSNVMTKDENGDDVRDYDAATSVEDAGLITAADLRTKPVIYVPTTNKIVSKGSTFFDSPLGRPFLALRNAYVKLQNRRLTKNEAATIYEAIHQLSIDVFKNGNAKSEESRRLFNWLKSIVYWGSPRNVAGYNSIFFEKTDQGLMLFISGKGKSFPFSPSSIQENKAEILSGIELMYNNINYTMVSADSATQAWKDPYEEIVSISPDGKIETREWQNYQTYLLSQEGRKAEELPLFTQMVPYKDDVPNRDGVYFTLTDTADTERYSKPPKPVTATAIPATLAPVAPGAPVPSVAAAPVAQLAPVVRVAGEFDIEGGENTIAIGANGTATFTIDAKKYIDTDGAEGFNVDIKGETIQNLMTNKGYTQDQAKEAAYTFIISKAQPQIDVYKEQLTKEQAGEEASAQEAPKTPVEPVRIVPPSAADMALIRQQMNNMKSKTPLRKIIEKQIKNFKPENWKQVEAFLKTALPTIPVYRVKNVIQATNGAQAWGMFQNGAIYINENAEVGTVYHEVFHAVWRMFSDPVEQVMVMDEFKKRSGSFTDRPTGQTIKYSEATDNQIEEQLAEEYRDYVQYGKIPAKPASGRPYIVKLFSDLANFIKEFFTGRKASTNVEKLFEKIGTGYYNQFNQNQSSLAFAKKGIIDIEEAYASSDSAFRIKNIPANQVHDIMQEMTYTILTDLTSNNKSLFSIPKLNKEEEYAKLLDSMQKTALSSAKATQELIDNNIYTPEQGQPFIDSSFALWKKITDEWDEIRKKHEEYLKTYSIEFDESNNSVLNDENNSGKGDYQDSRKIDLFKSANSAIKLLLSTIPIVDEKGDFIYSSINGAKLLPTSQVFMSLMNNLHTSRNIDEMMKRLREMAKNDPNYRTLYSRLTNTSYKTDTLDLADIDEVHDGQLLSAFWRTFKKQNPDVKNVYIFENGDIEIGDSNLSSAARQVSSEYVEAFKKVLTEKNSYFEYSTSKKAYIGKADGVKDVRSAFKKATTDSESLDIMISFLKSIGIEFKKEEIVKLPGEKQDAFKAAVNGVLSSIEKAKSVATVSGKVLDLEGRFMGLATIRAAINNPEFDSTFFNVQGERMQSFIGTNTASDLFDVLSQLSNKRELAGTPYAYLLTDEFSQFSVIIDKMFDSETGDRIAGSEQLMKTGYVDGTVNQENGKKKESSKLTYKERLIQEINLNLKGWYYSLVPGDASIEWMTKMGNHVSADRLLSGFGDVHKIFKGYFLSELELSRSDRPIVSLKKRSERDLRFLKPILENYEEGLHDKIINAKGTELVVYEKFESKINNAVDAFINKEASNLRATLSEYGILTTTETGYKIENIAFSEAESMSEAVLNRQLNAVSINYMINNIEFHKILYSDPYQYSDELKRIKNFNSPRQAIVNGSAAMNAAYQKIWNKNYKPGDLGYTNFTDDFFRSTTLEDVIGQSDLKDYGTYEETDGGGIISMKALRQFKIRAGEWNDDNELQYEYDIAYEKVVKGKGLTEEEKKEKKLTLSAKEKASNIQEFTNKDGSVSYIGKNPDVKSTYTPIKPIVAGNKGNGRLYNDVLLDKFALYPSSFRIMHMINPESNAIRQYEKMKNENIDYVVFATGRKVGAEKLNPIYNPADGSFNNAEYEGIVNVPFGIMSIQSEVPSKDTTDVSRGSQATKLVTMDYMQAGVPVDFEIKDKPNATFTEKYAAWFDLKTEEAKETASPIYKEIRNNQTLLEEIMEEGYRQLLKKLGIEEIILSDKRKEFKIVDFSKAAETLRDEILKREVNDNISDALAGFLAGEAVLEATPAYQQVRNILYSIADKNVISPKMNGGLKVQIPATFLESVKAVGKPFVNKKGETKYSYESDTLDFYVDEDGKRVCEIIVGRWFKSDMSDADLLKYLNDTKEGQKILEGVAFRIPTQKQNSIDAFRIKQFMPREFGDSVIVPSALVKKVGSDFDIDKLSLYFKNVLVNAKGVPVLVPFFGYGEQAKKKVNDWLVENEFSSLIAKEDADAIDKLSEEDEDKDISEIDKYYKKSLQNAYIQSMQNLITHPKNFERLTTPNSADQLKDVASKITKQLGFEEFDYSSTGNMLSRRFMSRLRHAFVTGKYAIGIAAVNQTNHSLNQRQPIYVDFDRFDNVSNIDKKWLTGGTGKQEDLRVKFKNFNKLNIKGKMVATLSMIRNAEKSEKFPDGQDISDIIGQFIDGYVDISKGPWIMELGATPNVASTFLFLAKIGVPIDQVAYFMNQPIIRDYLRSIESAGYSYLFMDKFVKDIKEGKYKTSSKAKFDEIPSKTKLFETIGAKELTPEQNAEQQFILDEFLKYAKMAEHMFHVTQGSNFDTATFNDPYLVFKKYMQFIKAQNSIISSVDDLLENSFVGKIKSLIYDIRDSFAQILKSDNPTVRDIVQDVLMDYVDLPDNEFIKVAQKTVNDLFDWAVQVDIKLNAHVKSILIGNDTNASAARQIYDVIKPIQDDRSHTLHNNVVVKSLVPRFAEKTGQVNNLKIKNKDNKVYDQNQMIYAFQELKTHLDLVDSTLYKKLIALSILQSGLSNSPISFTSLIPYEDFKNIYNKTLSTLETFPNLANFADLNVFQRNNWNNDDLVPYKKGRLAPSYTGRYFYRELAFNDVDNLNKDIQSKKIPQVIKLSALSREANNDIITYSWEQDPDVTDADRDAGIKNAKQKKLQMRKEGDFSFIKKGLFKKVMVGDEALIHPDRKGNPQYIYKMINAWGDSFRANEFYDSARKSVIENGYIKVDKEVADSTISSYFGQSTPKEVSTIKPEGLPTIDNNNENNCG